GERGDEGRGCRRRVYDVEAARPARLAERVELAVGRSDINGDGLLAGLEAGDTAEDGDGPRRVAAESQQRVADGDGENVAGRVVVKNQERRTLLAAERGAVRRPGQLQTHAFGRFGDGVVNDRDLE